MAIVSVGPSGPALRDRDAIAWLAGIGIDYERWMLARNLPETASAEQILSAYATRINAWKLRGGYAIGYERNFGNVTYNASFNPPASAVISDTCNTGDASCVAVVTNQNLGPLGQSTGVSYLPPVELRHMDQNIDVAQTQFWSLAVQHQLAAGTVVEKKV